MRRRAFLKGIAGLFAGAAAAAVPYHATASTKEETLGTVFDMGKNTPPLELPTPSEVEQYGKLSADDINELVETTLQDLGKLRFQEIADNMQQYEVFSKWFKKDRVTFGVDLGNDAKVRQRIRNMIQWKSTPDIATQHEKLRATVRYNGQEYACEMLISRHEQMMSKVPGEIERLARERMEEDLVNHIFDDIPTCDPVGYTTGQCSLRGKAALVDTLDRRSTARTPCNVGYPTGYDPKEWKNFTSEYTDVSRDDAIDAMRYAMESMKPEPPVENEKDKRFRLYIDQYYNFVCREPRSIAKMSV